MTEDLLPKKLTELYEVHEYKHACAILKDDFPKEWKDIIEVLTEFRLLRTHVEEKGKNKSNVAKVLDAGFQERGWVEKGFDTKVMIDGKGLESPTHKIDCYKNRIALEIEWNNKDPFYDRDLNNFRLLFDLRAISVGVIVARRDELQDIFDDLGKGSSYGNSTTHMSKLIPRIEGGSGGGLTFPQYSIQI